MVYHVSAYLTGCRIAIAHTCVESTTDKEG